MINVHMLLGFLIGFAAGSIITPCLLVFFLVKLSIKDEARWSTDI